MAIILITGGSGLIGKALSEALLGHGHAVRWLSRASSRNGRFASYTWNPSQGSVDAAALEGVDAIVHLAGAGVADKRWTPARVNELIASRAETARLLLRECSRQGAFPSAFISAAGVGYYGAISVNERLKEDAPPGHDTIARISVEWERAVDEWSGVSRVVKLRTPIVLSDAGGALPTLARVARWCLASPIGSGRQHMPWVHITDLVEAYMKALSDASMRGAYNIAASDASNEEFMRTIAHVLHRPFILPRVPAPIIRLALGSMAEILLEGSAVDDSRLRETGFRYHYDELEPVLRSLLQKT